MPAAKTTKPKASRKPRHSVDHGGAVIGAVAVNDDGTPKTDAGGRPIVVGAEVEAEADDK